MSRLLHDNLTAPTGMDNTSDPGVLGDTTAQSLVNWTADRAGLLRGQCQFSDITLSAFTFPIDGIGFLPPQQADARGWLCVGSNGTLYSYHAPSTQTIPPTWGAATSTLASAYNGLQVVRFAAFYSELYATAGFAGTNRRLKSDGTFDTQGIAVPAAFTVTDTAGGGAVIKTGRRYYTWTYSDELGRESSPFIVNESDTSSPYQVNFLTTTHRAKLDAVSISANTNWKINFYATLLNGTQLHRIAQVANPGIGTVTQYDDYDDPTIAGGTLAPNFGENDPPAASDFIAVHKNRLVMNIASAKDSIQVSNAGSGTQFATAPALATDGFRSSVGSDYGDDVTGLVSLGSELVIFKRRSIHMLYGDDNTDFLIRPLDVGSQNAFFGCVAPDSVVQCGNVVFFLADDGVYGLSKVNGYLLEKISKPIEASLYQFRGANRILYESAIGWYHKNRYHLALKGVMYVYDLTLQAWSTVQLLGNLYSVTAACVVHQQYLPQFVLLGRSDTNKVTWFDTDTAGVSVSGLVWRTRPIQTQLPYQMRSQFGEQHPRTGRKFLRRIKVYGTGTISSGSIVCTCDTRTETYNSPLFQSADDAQTGVLFSQEFTPAMTGRLIDFTFTLAGTSLIITDVKAEYTFQGN